VTQAPKSSHPSTTNSHLTPPSWKAAKQKSKSSAIKKVTKQAAAPTVAAPTAVDDDDVLPAAWPKPGHGLYAQLPPEKDDPFLMDEDDVEAFSHFMVNQHGKQIVGPVGG
jgi:hypothetical protein